MKRILIIMIVLVLIPFSVLAEDFTPICKKHTFGLKVGYHWYSSSEFFNKWQISKDDYNNEIVELEYEYRYSDKLGFSIPLGINSSSKSESQDMIPPINYKMKNYSISPTVKYYQPISSGSVFAFFGCGLNVYLTDAVFSSPGVRTVDRSETDLGVHISLGLEWNLCHNPGQYIFKWPVSFFIENRYSWNEHEEIDKDFISEVKIVHPDFEMQDNDLRVGGNTLFIGMRYHF